MTTNQTIDGVPREVIVEAERIATGYGFPHAGQQLREILESSRPSVVPRVIAVVGSDHTVKWVCGDWRAIPTGTQLTYANHLGHKPAAQPRGEQVAHMPVERCYDVRVKMIIAFNEAKKAGGDLDDALDAAYKSALRYSPNPMSAEQPAPVAVVLPERKSVNTHNSHDWDEGHTDGWKAYDAELKRLNPSL